jgi:hypothetical protein
MHMRTRLATLVAALIVTTAALVAAAEEVDLETKIEAAATAADHEAIAAEYGRQADEARKLAHRHDRMDNRYRQSRKARAGMHTHCKRLADNYRANAKELDALAEGHLEMAKELSQ